MLDVDYRNAARLRWGEVAPERQMIPYENLDLTRDTGQVLVYSNFVQTIDGKTQVRVEPNRHWPIGSRADYRGLLELRARADVLIHGRKTAEWIRTLDSLADKDFQGLRAERGRHRPLLYVVVSAHPTTLLGNYLADPPDGAEALLVTTHDAKLGSNWRGLPVLRLSGSLLQASDIVSALKQLGHRSILVEGGPTLLSHFVDEGQLDELFLTIAPKIYGGSSDETLSLINRPLYTNRDVKIAQLSGVFPLGDELYVRYRLRKGDRNEG